METSSRKNNSGVLKFSIVFVWYQFCLVLFCFGPFFVGGLSDREAAGRRAEEGAAGRVMQLGNGPQIAPPSTQRAPPEVLKAAANESPIQKPLQPDDTGPGGRPAGLLKYLLCWLGWATA